MLHECRWMNRFIFRHIDCKAHRGHWGKKGWGDGKSIVHFLISSEGLMLVDVLVGISTSLGVLVS